MKYRRCKCCGKIKLYSEFRRNICKECENKKNKERYKERGYHENNKAKVKGYVIYKLLKNEEILYIGKTKQLYVRLKSHRTDKDFDKVEILKFNSEIDMALSEIYFINKFKPTLNKEYKFNEDSKFNCLNSNALDKLKWLEVDLDILTKNKSNATQQKIEKEETSLEEVKNKTFLATYDGSFIDVMEISTFFIRKRSSHWLLYLETKEGKQKLISKYSYKREANKHLKEYKQLKSRCYK